MPGRRLGRQEGSGERYFAGGTAWGAEIPGSLTSASGRALARLRLTSSPPLGALGRGPTARGTRLSNGLRLCGGTGGVGRCDQCRKIPSRKEPGQAMATLCFKDDDDGYLEWCTSHPNGFVVNTWRNPTASYAVLHTARCWHITKTRIKGAYTARGYKKICGDSEAELSAELHRLVHSSFSKVCPCTRNRARR